MGQPYGKRAKRFVSDLAFGKEVQVRAETTGRYGRIVGRVTLPDGTERGMIFVFDHEDYHSFWMKNVIIPLDIAYIDSDGTIVSTYTMAPLDSRQGRYPSVQPVRYAIEVSANVWTRLGIEAGDQLVIPASTSHIATRTNGGPSQDR